MSLKVRLGKRKPKSEGKAGRVDQAADPTYTSRSGYALVASQYEHWHWFQFWQRNEVPIVQRWASSLKPGLFLDAGSGTGLYRPVLEEAGHAVISADCSPEMLAVQAHRHPEAALVCADIRSLPFPPAYFEYVLCTRVLNHIQALDPVFSEFARVTKPNGELLISDVHPRHRYSDMSVPVNGERISIETFKHPREEIEAALVPSLQILGFEEFQLNNLHWKPPIQNFENIYDAPERPIFYVAVLRRV